MTDLIGLDVDGQAVFQNEGALILFDLFDLFDTPGQLGFGYKLPIGQCVSRQGWYKPSAGRLNERVRLGRCWARWAAWRFAGRKSRPWVGDHNRVRRG